MAVFTILKHLSLVSFRKQFLAVRPVQQGTCYVSFLLSGNYELQISGEIFPSFLSCYTALQVAVCCSQAVCVSDSGQSLFGNQKKCFLYPKECFSRKQRVEVVFCSPCVFRHYFVQCWGRWGAQTKSRGILGIVLGSCRCVKQHLPSQPAMPTQWCE